MMLFTKKVRDQLKANFNSADEDHAPVVKLFNPAGSQTWIFTEFDEEQDLLFGLCDMGMGSPECGYQSYSEMKAYKGSFGLPIERDRHWKPIKGMYLSEYATQARTAGRIVDYPKNPNTPAVMEADAYQLGLDARV
jgi:hypothetical protein